MRDFKYSIWLDDIFIRNMVVTEGSKYEAEKAVLRNLQYLYRKKWMALTFKLEK